ncbi:alpha/beta hydrolase [Colwellia sp. 39_35_sub15_T18]|nr:alpha/beta hydrolase [Colwellia sp. 39_35_sub15_T18]
MIEQELIASDGHKIQLYVWRPESPKAWVHINHGMSEHALRYEGLAQELVNAGYAVVAHNHRGHGSSETSQLGSYAEVNGWEKVLTDLTEVRAAVCDASLPFYLFGHSMGSFIVQSYLCHHNHAIDGLILSGSNMQPAALTRIAKFVAQFEKLRLGRDKSSALMQFLSFGSFNQTFKPCRTQYDWLSRDHAQVDKYIADPLCGFDCSIGLWHDLLSALIPLFEKSSLAKIQANLPIFMLGGAKDPVGMMGKGLPNLAKAYKNVGQNNVSLKVYEDGRHEMLNEINHDEVMTDIVQWLDAQCLRA